MELFRIDQEKCKRDGICVASCPLKIIEQKDPEAIPSPTREAAELCFRCGHCVAGLIDMVGYPKFHCQRLPLRNPAVITWKG